VVNYIAKAGTNSFHGTGYEIYNGNWLDSLANQDKSALFGAVGRLPTAFFVLTCCFGSAAKMCAFEQPTPTVNKTDHRPGTVRQDKGLVCGPEMNRSSFLASNMSF